MSTRPFRFGVVHGGPKPIQDAARSAQALGYDTLLVPDTTSTPEPFAALSAAAAVTTSLRLGTWVLCDPLRSAARPAWQARTLQTLAEGRFELGIGVGRPGAEADCARLGVPFASPGERIAALAETVDAVRADLPGTAVLVAAGGPRLLALAADVANTVAFGWAPTTDSAAATERIAAVREAAGERFADLELAAGLIAVGEEQQPWLERAGLRPRELAEAGAVTVVTGEAPAMADALRRQREQLGLSYFTVPSAARERFAPVVAELAGS